MPVKFSCFISYASLESAWVPEYDAFINKLEQKLQRYLQWFIDEPPWRYATSQSVGAKWQDVLPSRLCESVCMIVLYVPRYEVSEMCVREYVAMEYIEQKRRQLLEPPLDPNYGMILPIVLKKRVGGHLPPWIQQSINYLDLSQYITPEKSPIEALDDPRCEQRLEEIAGAIAEVHRALVTNQPDPCQIFIQQMPSLEDERVIARWIGRRTPPTLPFRQPAA